MEKRSRIVPLCLIFGLWACGGSSPSETAEDKVTDEGVDIEKNPLSALKALDSIGGDLENLQKDLENMPETEAVSFTALIPALPDPPAGWEAEEPRGETNQMGDFKFSTASRTYTNGEKRVQVDIADWAFRKVLWMPFMLTSKFSQESTDGYNKGITIGEDTPGREEHFIKELRGSRQVLYKKRYHIQIEQNGGGPEVYDAWYALIKKDLLPTQ